MRNTCVFQCQKNTSCCHQATTYSSLHRNDWYVLRNYVSSKTVLSIHSVHQYNRAEFITSHHTDIVGDQLLDSSYSRQCRTWPNKHQRKLLREVTEMLYARVSTVCAACVLFASTTEQSWVHHKSSRRRRWESVIR